MRVSLDQISKLAGRVIPGHEIAARSCAWLEGCGYPGIKLLLEARADERQALELVPDAMGLDLKSVSCVFLAPAIAGHVAARGRVFLRNVRHGLYLLPLAVEANIGIGCPVDPAFALGGERSKNPYKEKLETAARDGVAVDDELWQRLGVDVDGRSPFQHSRARPLPRPGRSLGRPDAGGSRRRRDQDRGARRRR